MDKGAIARTYEMIRPYIRRTPVLDWGEDDFAPGALTLKLELLQHAGSFKARGAFANLLSREIPVAGVCAASGGNHGAAVAYAAMKRGVKAHIFVPAISSPAKIARIRDFGATLIVEGDSYADALAASEEWRRGSGALAIHAFDQAETMLGQGTLARRRPDCRYRRLVRRPYPRGWRRAGGLADPDACLGGGPAG
jgi:threonine dehydratase